MVMKDAKLQEHEAPLHLRIAKGLTGEVRLKQKGPCRI